MSSKAIMVLTIAGAALAVSMTGCEKKEARLTYQADIKPVLDQYCVECHKFGAQGTEKSGLMLDSYAAAMQGTKYGAVISPGQAISSTLYLLVAGKADPSIRMPHGGNPLPEETVNKIRDWIDQGAMEK